MKAFILAAGFGTRLRPFTDHNPKALVPVNGIPLIFYTLAFLKHHRITDVTINLHHHGDKIQKLLKNGKHLGLTIHYSHEPKILGTGGGIKKALRNFEDDMLVINGDVITDFDLEGLVRQHLKYKPLMTIALHNHPHKEKYGLLHYDHHRLTSILGQPTPPPAAKSAMYASYHILSKKLSREAFAQFKQGEMFCIMRDIYIPEIQKNQGNFGAFILNGYWGGCDSLEDIKKVERDLTRKDFRLSYQKELRQLQAAC